LENGAEPHIHPGIEPFTKNHANVAVRAAAMIREETMQIGS
jgi:hypothetical protein